MQAGLTWTFAPLQINWQLPAIGGNMPRDRREANHTWQREWRRSTGFLKKRSNKTEGTALGFAVRTRWASLILLSEPSWSAVSPHRGDDACVHIYSNANNLNIFLHNRIVENVAEVIQESTGEAISRLLVYEMLYSSEHLISYTLDLKGQETKLYRRRVGFLHPHGALTFFMRNWSYRLSGLDVQNGLLRVLVSAAWKSHHEWIVALDLWLHGLNNSHTYV